MTVIIDFHLALLMQSLGWRRDPLFLEEEVYYLLDINPPLNNKLFDWELVNTQLQKILAHNSLWL